MSQIGIGVMIHMLGGNEESVAYNDALEKLIESAELRDDALFLHFTDKTAIRFMDEGQSCCEHRYMTCGDDLTTFAGAKFVGAEIREAPDAHEEDDYGEPHEVQFLVVKTDRGNITCETHNVHNGYYGGFWVTVAAL